MIESILSLALITLGILALGLLLALGMLLGFAVAAAVNGLNDGVIWLLMRGKPKEKPVAS